MESNPRVDKIRDEVPIEKFRKFRKKSRILP